MIRKVLIVAFFLLTPFFVFAAPATFRDLVQDYLLTIINNVVLPLIFAVSLLVFIWGVYQYLFSPSQENIEKGRNLIIYGLIGFFVMVSVWGLVRIVYQTFFGPLRGVISNNQNLSENLPNLPPVGSNSSQPPSSMPPQGDGSNTNPPPGSTNTSTSPPTSSSNDPSNTALGGGSVSTPPTNPGNLNAEQTAQINLEINRNLQASQRQVAAGDVHSMQHYLAKHPTTPNSFLNCLVERTNPILSQIIESKKYGTDYSVDFTKSQMPNYSGFIKEGTCSAEWQANLEEEDYRLGAEVLIKYLAWNIGNQDGKIDGGVELNYILDNPGFAYLYGCSGVNSSSSPNCDPTE